MTIRIRRHMRWKNENQIYISRNSRRQSRQCEIILFFLFFLLVSFSRSVFHRKLLHRVQYPRLIWSNEWMRKDERNKKIIDVRICLQRIPQNEIGTVKYIFIYFHSYTLYVCVYIYMKSILHL